MVRGYGMAFQEGRVSGRARIIVVALFLALWGGLDHRVVHAQEPFGFEAVANIAQALATKPFGVPVPQPPAALQNLSYDDYRKIRFRPEMALWRDRRLFEIQLFHIGFLYRLPVRINLIENNQIVQVQMRRELFDYSDVNLPEALPSDLGFAGLRVHFPLHTPDYKDEVAVFLGSSYFRILGRDQQFGVSARGLAIDTALPKGEEFPFFREFWLVVPAEHETDLVLYALLDSQRLSGAYQFILRPGTDTKIEVRKRIFVREGIDKLGVAPLTSMFFFGENSSRHSDDYRPEVHDSDGLLILNGAGEWIWRPLANPGNLRVSAFVDNNPRGFGLMQRDREFANYLDLEAHYHSRPSLWVEPVGDWGPGTVELVEIPTEDETNDNIVAFWVPDRNINKGDVLDFTYRLSAELTNPHHPPLGQAVRTRTGAPQVPGSGETYSKDTRLFVVDFEGGDLQRLSPQQPVRAMIATSAGRTMDTVVMSDKQTGLWRVAFRLDPGGAAAVDLKLFLSLHGRPLTEQWTYLWTPSLKQR